MTDEFRAGYDACERDSADAGGGLVVIALVTVSFVCGVVVGVLVGGLLA
jgi:hypothetical protein